MHEFSIALEIIKIAEDNARQANAEKIIALDIEVGKFSGVIKDALRFALESAAKNSMLENARVNIIEKEARAECRSCHKQFSIENFADVCPHCGSVWYSLLQGSELQVKSIEIE